MADYAGPRIEQRHTQHGGPHPIEWKPYRLHGSDAWHTLAGDPTSRQLKIDRGKRAYGGVAAGIEHDGFLEKGFSGAALPQSPHGFARRVR